MHTNIIDAICNALIRAVLSRIACQHWPPHLVNTDKNPAYGEALRQLKRDEPNVGSIEHRQAKYLNNRIEADHGPIKRLCRATLRVRGDADDP
jgi:transposase-like protein